MVGVFMVEGYSTSSRPPVNMTRDSRKFNYSVLARNEVAARKMVTKREKENSFITTESVDVDTESGYMDKSYREWKVREVCIERVVELAEVDIVQAGIIKYLEEVTV